MKSLASAVALTTLLALSACGGSDSDSSSGTSTAGSGADFLSKPLKIAFLWSKGGEDAASSDYYDNGGQMAIDEINAAGGVGGQQVETVRYQSSPLDPANVISNFLKAVDDDPDFIIGLPAPSAEAASGEVTKAGIPTFSITQNQNLNLGAKAGSEWLFTTVTNDGLQAVSAANFVTEKLGAKSVGLLHTNEAFGTTGSDIQQSKLEAEGVDITANVPYAVDATDLTAAVLSVKDSDAVIDWGYPNPVGVQLNQFVQNGIDIPTVTGGAAPYIVDGKLASGDAIKNLYSIDPCNPTDNPDPKVADWRDNYQAKYDAAPTASSAQSYDAVYLAVAAIKAAGSTDHEKVRDALRTLNYTDGICTDDYHADGANAFQHSVTVISWAGGVGKTEDVLTFDDQAEGTPDPS